MAAGNGPGPSGTCRSRSKGLPPGRVYSTSLRSKSAAASVAKEKTRMKSKLRIGRDCNRQSDMDRPGGLSYLGNKERTPSLGLGMTCAAISLPNQIGRAHV